MNRALAKLPLMLGIAGGLTFASTAVWANDTAQPGPGPHNRGAASTKAAMGGRAHQGLSHQGMGQSSLANPRTGTERSVRIHASTRPPAGEASRLGEQRSRVRTGFRSEGRWTNAALADRSETPRARVDARFNASDEWAYARPTYTDREPAYAYTTSEYREPAGYGYATSEYTVAPTEVYVGGADVAYGPAFGPAPGFTYAPSYAYETGYAAPPAYAYGTCSCAPTLGWGPTSYPGPYTAPAPSFGYASDYYAGVTEPVYRTGTEVDVGVRPVRRYNAEIDTTRNVSFASDRDQRVQTTRMSTGPARRASTRLHDWR